jgi:hypothetical protein
MCIEGVRGYGDGEKIWNEESFNYRLLDKTSQ